MFAQLIVSITAVLLLQTVNVHAGLQGVWYQVIGNANFYTHWAKLDIQNDNVTVSDLLQTGNVYASYQTSIALDTKTEIAFWPYPSNDGNTELSVYSLFPSPEVLSTIRLNDSTKDLYTFKDELITFSTSSSSSSYPPSLFYVSSYDRTVNPPTQNILTSITLSDSSYVSSTFIQSIIYIYSAMPSLPMLTSYDVSVPQSSIKQKIIYSTTAPQQCLNIIELYAGNDVVLGLSYYQLSYYVVKINQYTGECSMIASVDGTNNGQLFASAYSLKTNSLVLTLSSGWFLVDLTTKAVTTLTAPDNFSNSPFAALVFDE